MAFQPGMGRFGASWTRWRRKGAGKGRIGLLLWATLIAGICGAINLGKPIEGALRSTRNLLRGHDASGQIVIVGIDDKSLAEFSAWPWPRRRYAELTDALVRAGARRVFIDINFDSPSSEVEDRLLEEGLARHSDKVVLPSLEVVDAMSRQSNIVLPLSRFARHASLAFIGIRYDFQGVAWALPFDSSLGRVRHPSFAAKLANVVGPAGESFPVDYSIDPKSIPLISASDVIQGRVPDRTFAGKDVVIGATSHQLGDTFFAPGGGLLAGPYLHVLGAETLIEGTPKALGWFAPFAFALLLACASFLLRSAGKRVLLIGAGISACLLAPLGLDAMRIYVETMPALTLLLIVGGRLAWLRHRAASDAKAVLHKVSGLPTLTALRESENGQRRPLIVARITNFAEIVSSLEADQEGMLVQQVVGRLTLGSVGQKLFHGDEGVFAWFADDEMAVTLTDHLNALHNLFRSPVVLANTQIDLTIAFGVEGGSDRSVANRLGGALVAADEAAAQGLRWKEYDSTRLKEAPWRLSLLSQLDAAIDTGELWVAYQPKLDIRTNRMIGAEALVRWTHPDKGPISPAEFVLAAEQSGRIHKLTTYVLERAIQAAAALNQRGIPFSIAVNLSARLIDDAGLPEWVSGLLVRHGLRPEQLVLEITETAALGTSMAHLANLARLRDLGVGISVDDYGTGLSTLDYLKKIPACEIKIDKSFVQAMHRSDGDRVIVNSTIQLAHSLGRRVVAEGVEDRETLDALSRMGCDIAQGFYIGRPLPLRGLARLFLQDDRVLSAAG
ncbi:MAG TPA: EAL domain-containing protein [Allosphingosinicella sp.]|jgi:EAL domain-containing protein (putative c-di-GMP-specific phosphodiesterase class I)/CHASE2 domain-containing sensor protein|uniref:EAL domain-containing protein n=1 Tax=Allosphingosinicella sp. TaxID=2823234 RepID=UPI002F27D76A